MYAFFIYDFRRNRQKGIKMKSWGGELGNTK